MAGESEGESTITSNGGYRAQPETRVSGSGWKNGHIQCSRCLSYTVQWSDYTHWGKSGGSESAKPCTWMMMMIDSSQMRFQHFSPVSHLHKVHSTML